jgi:hypothetical protein
MKRIYLIIILAIAAFSAACGNSKPNIGAAPLTEPWISMNLSCRDEAVVLVSDERKLVCAYGGKNDRERSVKLIASDMEILKRQGWKVVQEIPDVGLQCVLEKADKRLLIFSTPSPILTADGMKKWEGFAIQSEISVRK